MLSKAVILIGAIGAQLLGAADFLPLQVGNRWTYREAKTGQTLNIQVGVPTFVNNKIYYSLRGYVQQIKLVRYNEAGDLVYLGDDQVGEYILTSFTPFEGGWWNAPFRQCDQEGQTQRQRVLHDGPSGTFSSALQIRYRTFTCADAGIQSETFVENIGMVRRVENSFIGPRQLDLVSATVGKVEINTATNGRFEVIAEKNEKGDALNVTIRVKASPATPFTLEYPTAQEYEIVLLDPAGRAVWAWSTGKVFAFALHTRSIAGEWSASTTVPLPTNPEGTFIVQSWLTTTGRMPTFAATVPVVFSSIQR